MKKLIFATALAVVALAGAAIAQTVAVPQVSTLNPTADRVQIVPNGAPSARSVYASPAQLGTTGYYVKVPAADILTAHNTTGYTWTFANYQGELLLDPSGTLEYAYITFSPNPSDGARQCIFSTAATTALYPTANTGQTVNDALTAGVANTRYCYTYGASNLTWDRSQ